MQRNHCFCNNQLIWLTSKGTDLKINFIKIQENMYPGSPFAKGILIRNRSVICNIPISPGSQTRITTCAEHGIAVSQINLTNCSKINEIKPLT